MNDGTELTGRSSCQLEQSSEPAAPTLVTDFEDLAFFSPALAKGMFGEAFLTLAWGTLPHCLFL